MDLRDLVGRRVLATTSIHRTVGSIQEYRILEVSPSGNYTRIMDAFGHKIWRLSTDLIVVETLVMPEPYPRDHK